MKITKDILRGLIKECMHDMGGYEKVSNMMPPASAMPVSPAMGPPMAPPQPQNIDPDGYEGHMAKTNLFKIAEYATELHNMIQNNENLEPWVEEKIAVAASMMDAVGHHLKYKKINPG